MKTKTRHIYLESPNGAKVTRHVIGGENNEIRFTTPAKGFDRLVAVSRGDQFTWIHKDFRK